MTDSPPDLAPVVARPTFDVNDLVRAVVILVALAAVCYLAIVLANQAAAGGLLTLLAAATGYLFRGRVQTTDSSTPVVTNVPPVR